METLVQHHFYALALFGAAAFMLGLVSRAVGDHLLGRKRERERELRDLLWREVELTLELESVRRQIQMAPADMRASAFELARDQAGRWADGLRGLAQRLGYVAPQHAVAPVVVEEQIPSAWSLPPPR